MPSATRRATRREGEQTPQEIPGRTIVVADFGHLASCLIRETGPPEARAREPSRSTVYVLWPVATCAVEPGSPPDGGSPTTLGCAYAWPHIARRGTPHGSGLSIHRWVIERTIALLHWFRRL